MHANEILNLRDQIISEDGPWTAHWLELAPGVETLPGKKSYWEFDRAMLALQSASLALGKPAKKIRALDLGALEGGISIALAKNGCEVIGVEMRAKSLRKAKFAAKALDLENVNFIQGDMLRLNELRLGTFDLIICAGTLYHVDALDLLPFMRSLNDACKGVAIFDTHISLVPSAEYTAAPGLNVRGQSFVEHAPNMQDTKEDKLWASSENNFAFWPTERSLANLLLSAGFSQIVKPLAPIPEWLWQDRAYWVAYSSTHAREMGVSFKRNQRLLADPDIRPLLCPAIQNPIHNKYLSENINKL